MSDAKRRVLVTGGAGFIGSTVVRHLLATKNEVLTIDSLTYASNLSSLPTAEQNPSHSFLKVDICEKAKVEEAIAAFQPHWIMHLAAESHVDWSIQKPGRFIETNIVGTFNVLESARKYWQGLPGPIQKTFRFLHVSTDEVYGTADDDEFFTETTSYDPSSPYAASKAASDHLARSWHRTFGLPVIVSNCSNNYGPFQFPEKLIPLTITNLIQGRQVPIYGNGDQVRDWLFVEDHARALHAVIANGRVGETYVIGGHSQIRNIDVVTSICSLLDRLCPQDEPHRTLLTFVADRPGHDGRYAIDSRKIETELGWRPQQDFTTGLEVTVSWYLKNRWWWEPPIGTTTEMPSTNSRVVKPSL